MPRLKGMKGIAYIIHTVRAVSVTECNFVPSALSLIPYPAAK
jgi:hypothetical protein